MTEPSTKDDLLSGTESASFWLLAGLLVFAPLFRGGVPPLPLMALEFGALILFILVFWAPHGRKLRAGEELALLALFLLPVVYLVPYPEFIAEHFPGRELYHQARRLAAGPDSAAFTKISLFPLETQGAWLALLPPLAVFLAARYLDTQHLFRLVMLVLVIAGVQATLGLIQFGDGRDSPFYLGMDYAHFGSAVGTYTNRNHFAGFLEMVLPIGLALYVASLGRGERRGYGRGWRRRMAFVASWQGHRAFLYGALCLLVLLALIFSRSRTGIALTMLGILLALFAFARRLGGDNVYGFTGSVVAVAIGLGSVIGLAPVLNRFSAQDPLTDARWSIFSHTLDGIGRFFPLGSGPGNYPDVFPAFQPLELGRWTINHAHNDYLEWLFEGGLLAAAVILLLLWLYLRQWPRVWSKSVWSRFRFVQVGAGIGIFLMLLHGFLDYNLHTPANMVYLALLLAVFFHESQEEERQRPAGKRRGRTQRMPATVQPEAPPMSQPPPDQIRNPFLD